MCISPRHISFVQNVGHFFALSQDVELSGVLFVAETDLEE